MEFIIKHERGKFRESGTIHRLYFEGKEIGLMTTFINYYIDEPDKPWLEIERLHNLTKNSGSEIKGVGSYLINDAISHSIKIGLQGRIRVDAVGDSHFFYWKMGFRPDIKYDIMWCSMDAYVIYNKLIKNLSLTEEETELYNTLKEKAYSRYNRSNLSHKEILTTTLTFVMNKEYNKAKIENRNPRWSGSVIMSYNP